jgi:hypothetical protein
MDDKDTADVKFAPMTMEPGDMEDFARGDGATGVTCVGFPAKLDDIEVRVFECDVVEEALEVITTEPDDIGGLGGSITTKLDVEEDGDCGSEEDLTVVIVVATTTELKEMGD